MTGKDFITDLFAREQQGRAEEGTRQAYRLERRRIWLVAAARRWETLQADMRKLTEDFNANVSKAVPIAAMLADYMNDETFALRYGAYQCTVRFDRDQERLFVSTNGARERAYDMELADDGILLLDNGDYVLRGEEAVQLTGAFFREAVRFAGKF
jgi:mRNA-degrading endonuclease RelE of RelBE toxin-antitoxin system